MKPKGGYDIGLSGRPAAKVAVLPEPEVLHLPLASRRFRFSQLCVEDGERVEPGHVLAKDPDNYSVPLIAPRAGNVRLRTFKNHITFENVAREPEEPYHPDEDREHVSAALDSPGIKRYKLLELGVWQFLFDAHTPGAGEGLREKLFSCAAEVAKGLSK